MLDIEDFFLNLDAEILIFLNSIHINIFDQIMWYVTTKWTWIPLYASILYVIIKRGNKYAIALSIIAFVLTIVVSDQFCSSIIRPYFHRLRPSNPSNSISSMLHLINGYRGGKYGMPSCHAANSFGLAVFMMTYFKNKTLNYFMFSWAILNAYSRIYTGVHYPSDIFVGIIIGVLSALLIFYGMRTLNTKNRMIADITTRTWNNKMIMPIIYTGGLNIMAIIVYSIYLLYI